MPKRTRDTSPASPESVLTPWLDGRPKEPYTTSEERLHDEIIVFASYISPTFEETFVRQNLFDAVSKIVHGLIPDASVDLFGSFPIGMQLPEGDLDIVVTLPSAPNPSLDPDLQQQIKKKAFRLAKLLHSSGIVSESRVNHFARVPVVISQSTANYGRMDFDISFNHTDGLLVAQYMRPLLDPPDAPSELPHASDLHAASSSLPNQHLGTFKPSHTLHSRGPLNPADSLQRLDPFSPPSSPASASDPAFPKTSTLSPSGSEPVSVSASSEKRDFGPMAEVLTAKQALEKESKATGTRDTDFSPQSPSLSLAAQSQSVARPHPPTTSLMYMPALRPLVMVLKAFLRQRGINSAARGGLSSYPLICMVISFLQCNPTNLPLQYITNPIEARSLGILLTDFMRYYGTEFPYTKSYISVTQGRLLPRAKAVGKDGQRWINDTWHCKIAIQCVIDPENDIGKGTSRMKVIVAAFKEAAAALLQLSIHDEHGLGTIVGLSEKTLAYREYLRDLVHSKKLQALPVNFSINSKPNAYWHAHRSRHEPQDRAPSAPQTNALALREETKSRAKTPSSRMLPLGPPANRNHDRDIRDPYTQAENRPRLKPNQPRNLKGQRYQKGKEGRSGGGEGRPRERPRGEHRNRKSRNPGARS